MILEIVPQSVHCMWRGDHVHKKVKQGEEGTGKAFFLDKNVSKCVGHHRTSPVFVPRPTIPAHEH